jgi:hypothetical protein
MSGGTWTLPVANMQDPDIAVVARSANATNAATTFRVDLGSEKQVDGMAFGPCNLSPGATWRAVACSDSGYTTVVYDTGVLSINGEIIDWADTASWLEWEDSGFWLGISDYSSLTELPQFNYHIVPVADIADATARYWEFTFDDELNADGYLDIGRLVMAAAFRPAHNYNEDNSLSFEQLVDIEESLGGKRQYFERGIRRVFRAGFTHLTKDELFGDTLRMALRSARSRQVFVVPDPDDVDHGARRSFLATLKEVPAIQQLLVSGRGSTSFDFVEVL